MAGSKEIDLDVGSRQKDIRITVGAKEHADLFFSVKGGGTHRDVFEGPYAVTSEIGAMQVLQTENKLMSENMIVLPVPYFETSNEKGGITFYIGGD